MVKKKSGSKKGLHKKCKSLSKEIILLILFLVFVLFLLVVGSSITGGVYYYDYGSYGGASGMGLGYSFTSLYYQYGYLIDAFVFLLIFLGVGKMVFGKQYGEHGKPLYIGLGLFLAFALLLWEERTGVFLLELVGPFAVGLLFIVFFVALALLLKRHFDMGVVWISSILILGLIALMYILRETAYSAYTGILNFFYNLWYPLGSFFESVTSFRSFGGFGDSVFWSITGPGIFVVLLVVLAIWKGWHKIRPHS